MRLRRPISADLRAGRKLSDFEVGRVKLKNRDTPSDMLVLQLDIAGVGVDPKGVLTFSKEESRPFRFEKSSK